MHLATKTLQLKVISEHFDSHLYRTKNGTSFAACPTLYWKYQGTSNHDFQNNSNQSKPFKNFTPYVSYVAHWKITATHLLFHCSWIHTHKIALLFAQYHTWLSYLISLSYLSILGNTLHSTNLFSFLQYDKEHSMSINRSLIRVIVQSLPTSLHFEVQKRFSPSWIQLLLLVHTRLCLFIDNVSKLHPCALRYCTVKSIICNCSVRNTVQSSRIVAFKYSYQPRTKAWSGTNYISMCHDLFHVTKCC